MVHHDYQGRALTRRQALQAGAAGAAAAACAWARPGAAWADDGTANNKKADSSSKGALYAFRDSDSRLWGYIDKQGVVVIKPTFKEVSNNPISGPITNLNATNSSAQARAVCEIADIGYGVFAGSAETVQDEESGLWGLIDRTGSWIIEPTFDRVTAVIEGIFAALEPDGDGSAYYSAFWSEDGKKLFDCSKDITSVISFVGGYTSVKGLDETWAVINTKGEWAAGSAKDTTKPYCYERPLIFSEGVAYDAASACYIDATGEPVLSLDAWNAHPYDEDFVTGLWSSEGVMCSGQPIPPTTDEFLASEASSMHRKTFDQASWTRFSEGVCVVESLDRETFGAIDANGDWVVQPKFSRMYDFHEGFAFDYTLNVGVVGDQGVIDLSGNWVITPQFSFLCEMPRFYRGLAFVSKHGVTPEGKETDVEGWITPEGVWVHHEGNGLKEESDD